MGKYRALVDIPPTVKAGDIVTLTEDPIPEYVGKLQPVGDDVKAADGEETDDEKILLGNPSREWLKARAEALGVDHAPNIQTAKLIELVKEAVEAEKAKAEAGAGDGNDNPDD
jgi:hypothetical protein